MPELEGRTSDVLVSFLAELKKAGGQNVTFGIGPTAYLTSSKAHISANNEPARQVLARLLSSAGRKVYWLLYYDYTLQFYALNFMLADEGYCKEVKLGSPRDVGDAEKAVLLDARPQ